MNALATGAVSIRGSPDKASGPPEIPTVRLAPAAPARPEEDPATSKPEPSRQEVDHAAAGVNAFLTSSGSHVQFALHQETKRMMVQVVDDRTQEVIKTIPSKELLDLAAKIGEMVGVLLDKKG